MSIFKRNKVPPNNVFAYHMIGARTKAGIDVSPDSAMRITAVWACVRILSETVASLPLITYERLDEGKRRAVEHPLFSVLHDTPNPYMTSFTFWEVAVSHLNTWGNFYAEIEYDGLGNVIALWPIAPHRVTVELRKGSWEPVYKVKQPSGSDILFPWDKVFHVPGLGYDGIKGYSPIAMQREAIGILQAMDAYEASFYANDATPRTVLVYPGAIDDEMEKNIRESWEARYKGVDNANKIAILEEGLRVERIGLPPGDAQFLDSRKFQVEEIARLYRIPLHLIQHQEKSTAWGTGIEQMNIGFVIHTIRPWLVRIEKAVNAKLFKESDRKRYFAEFLVDGLLRGDLKSRYEAYAIAREKGWLNADEIRAFENMNPLPGDQGKIYLAPMNLAPLGAPAPAKEAKGIREKRDYIKVVEPRARLMRSFHPLYSDAARRIVNREVKDIKKLAKKTIPAKGPEEFRVQYEEYYKTFAPIMKGDLAKVAGPYTEAVQAAAAREVGGFVGMTPVIEECAEVHLDNVVRHHINLSQMFLREAVGLSRGMTMSNDEYYSRVLEVLDGWESRADDLAEWEVVRHNNLIAKAVFFVNGVRRIGWSTEPYTTHELYDLCVAMGQIEVEMGDDCRSRHGSFWDAYMAQEKLSSTRDKSGFRPSWAVTTPPLWKGCKCLIHAITED